METTLPTIVVAIASRKIPHQILAHYNYLSILDHVIPLS
jgi:hypothetical protein